MTFFHLHQSYGISYLIDSFNFGSDHPPQSLQTTAKNSTNLSSPLNKPKHDC
jgi:hypothetical protein